MNNLFKRQINNIFSLKELEQSNIPIEVAKDYTIKYFGSLRVNHYLIKNNTKCKYKYGLLDPHIIELIEDCTNYLDAYQIDIRNRYCYVTVDQGEVKKGDTLRVGGWHIDGLQGDEVKNKTEADFQFIWCDKLPTLFSTQAFDMAGVDISKHNVFSVLDSQIRNNEFIQYKENSVILMNSYNVHRCAEAECDIYRRFIRIAFSKVPITSIKMTLNPDISYNYKVYTTSGEIPRFK